MRQKLTTFLSIIFLLISIESLNAQWIRLSGSPDGPLSFYTIGTRIVCGTYYWNGIYYSTNDGINWIHSNITNRNGFALAANATTMFAGTEYGVYKSTDNGSTWTLTPQEIFTLSLAFSNNNLFAGTQALGVYISTDNGNNWSQTALKNKTVLSLFVSGSKILAGTDTSGIFYSTNNGSNWYRSNLTTQYVYQFTSLGSSFYTASYGGIHKSTDGGVNWSQSGLNSYSGVSIISKDNYLFAGTFGNGVFLSSNGGYTWIPKNQGLGTALYISTLFVSGNYIYTGNGINVGILRRDYSEIIGIKKNSEEVPDKYSLYQNYPNPFNPWTIIKFQIKDSRLVTLKVYDILGKEIETLVSEKLIPGSYEVTFSASQYPSGDYFYQLSTEGFSETKKMLLIK